MRIVSLAVIAVIAWLLIMAEAYILFDFIIPFAPPIHTLGSLTATALLKVLMTLGLGALWFVVIISLSQAYVRSMLARRSPTSSS